MIIASFHQGKEGSIILCFSLSHEETGCPSRFVAFATTMYYITRVEKKTGGKSGNKWTATETSAWTGLVRTQQFLINRVEKELRENGLPPLSWYDVLWELERVPRGKLRLNEMGKRVLLDKYNVTRLVQRLENEGLVRRVPCPADGRGVFARITPEGRKLRSKMWPVYERAVKEHFLSKLVKKDIAQLDALIQRIRADSPS
jgi:DNA-binding MarR family transcriptional regulator